jgi:hypothetical protein
MDRWLKRSEVIFYEQLTPAEKEHGTQQVKKIATHIFFVFVYVSRDISTSGETVQICLAELAAEAAGHGPHTAAAAVRVVFCVLPRCVICSVLFMLGCLYLG